MCISVMFQASKVSLHCGPPEQKQRCSSPSQKSRDRNNLHESNAEYHTQKSGFDMAMTVKLCLIHTAASGDPYVFI